MTILAKKTDGEGGFFAPPGVQQAVCVDVIDRGLVTVTFENKSRQRHMISIIWQLGLIDPGTGQRYLAAKRYNLSLDEKATLRKDLESWRGKPFTRDEELGFDVERVKGANCLLNIQHVSKATGTYANVIAIMPALATMGKLTPQAYVRVVPDAPPAPVPPATVAMLPTTTTHTSQSWAQPVTDDDIPF